ncbi:DNA repair protein RadC [Vicingaceae bacterium]|nr:DNA repair protein RadC [Vicingaceae bacterium]MDB4082783.1 DNA repair protein RadC [Vicingaceae bacterium]
MEYEGNLTIKAWAEKDSPREKFALKGKSSLSDAELIAILIGSGNKNESAVELSKRILSAVNNNLNELGRIDLGDLMKFKGIGEAKAITIAAALELGRRRKLTEVIKNPKITSSGDIYEIMSPLLSDLKHEEFWVVILNQGNKVIHKLRVSSGGVAATIADPKLIFKPFLEKLGSSIILCHNHPSGNLTPSAAEIQLTKKNVEAGKLFDIRVLDHIIIANDKYYSFADEGMM